MSENIKITEDAVYKTILAQTNRGYSVVRPYLNKKFGVSDSEEHDRPRVWRLGQILAELVRKGWVSKTLSNADGLTYYRAVGQPVLVV